MEKDFKSYLDNIDENTIVISCVDAHIVNMCNQNKHILLYTFFANIIKSSNQNELNHMMEAIDFHGYKNVLFIGHHNCKIIEYLAKDKSNNPHWQEAKKHLQELKNLSFYKEGTINNDNTIVWLNVISQIKKISQLEFFAEKIMNEVITIKGIVVDEKDNLSVEEIEIPSNCFIC